MTRDNTRGVPQLPTDLRDNVAKWVKSEGYPLEFRTASAFRKAGFHVRQGEYVHFDDTIREIDVAASKSVFSEGTLLRVYHVVECKWTKEKPWIVLSAPNPMAPSACIAQTIASELGEAILWANAGLRDLHDMSLFSTPASPGFSGRQAFTEYQDNDVFYRTMQSVTSLATKLVQQYDEPPRKNDAMPKYGAVAFPLVAIDGHLFEVWFDETTSDVQAVERKHLRLHWRGSPSWRWHATVDIVVADHLDVLLRQRAAEVDQLLVQMARTRDRIARCHESASLDELNVKNGPRGMLGLPPLLHSIHQMRKRKLAAPGAQKETGKTGKT